jgi:hypothetical protein
LEQPWDNLEGLFCCQIRAESVKALGCLWDSLKGRLRTARRVVTTVPYRHVTWFGFEFGFGKD